MASSTQLLAVCRHRYPPRASLNTAPVFRCYSTTRAILHSTTNNDKTNDETNQGDHGTTKKRQPFVQQAVPPGQWDPFDVVNPLFRPKYEGPSKILRQDDFARRPKVGFSVAFENMTDGMINLTWMTHKDQKNIFEMYKALLLAGKDRYGVTSHEYVVRTVATRLKITAERVAAVVQLQWNQAKLELEGSAKVDLERGRYMDYCFLNEIRDCYKAYKMRPPRELSFVETAVGLPPKSKRWHEVEDVFDFDEIWRKYMQEYLPNKAKKMINDHVYLEDTFDRDVPTPVDKETLGFIEQQKRFTEISKEAESEDTPQELKDTDEDRPERRPRWKFVAQMVNTRTLKKKRREALGHPVLGFRQPLRRENLSTRYRNQCNENSLVEQDGEIRTATQEDINGVAWKPMRLKFFKTHNMREHLSIQEFTYRTAKLDWLNFFHGRPHSGVFGDQPKDVEEQLKKLQKMRGRRPQWDRKWGPRGANKEQDAEENE